MSEAEEKNATQPGAEGSEATVVDPQPSPTEGGGEETRKPVDARLSAMDAIADRLEKERAEEAGVEPEGEPGIQGNEVKEKADPGPKVLNHGDLANFKVKLKVDGEEQEVDLASLVKDGQKDKAADKKLMEASLALKEAQDALKAAKELELKLSGKGEKPHDDPPANADGQSGDDEEVTFDDFLDGNREKVEKFLKKVGQASKGGPEVPDAREVARQVELELTNKQTLQSFQDDYKDVMGDPLLADITHRFYQQVVSDGETSYDAALRKAGESTRQWLKDKGISTKATTTAPDLATKAERKKSIDNISPLNARSPSTLEQKEESVSDVIAAMRANRPGSR